MAESRSNHTGQTGMAILIIVVLFGVLFLGAGGLLWVWVRSERAQRAAKVEARYLEQIAREQAEVARRMVEEVSNAEDEKRENAPAVSSASGAALAEPNDRESADNSEVQTP